MTKHADSHVKQNLILGRGRPHIAPGAPEKIEKQPHAKNMGAASFVMIVSRRRVAMRALRYLGRGLISSEPQAD